MANPWQQGTQDTLEVKQEKFRTYPILSSDLIILPCCSLCGSEDFSVLTEVYLESELNFFSTSVCHNCLHVFRSIYPSIEWFKKCWRKIATDNRKPNPAVENLRGARYEGYYDILSKYAQNGRLLDVGAAYGTGSKIFQDNGFFVEAIEAENNKVDYIEQIFQIPVVSRSIETLIWGKRSYDVILLAHILEHLDDPKFVMSHIQNLLNPNAILYVSIPIFPYFIDWSDALYLAHRNNFSEENLINLITENGFEILERAVFTYPEDEPWDLGLVLRFATNPQAPRLENSYTVDDVRGLYRKNFPLEKVPPLNQTLKYSVLYIEHFYRTIKFGTDWVNGYCWQF